MKSGVKLVFLTLAAATVLPSKAPAQTTATDDDEPIGGFYIIDTKPRRGGFDAVGIFDLTFTNENSYPVKDATVVCEFFGQSGTLIYRKEMAVYQSFPPKAKKTIKNLNFGFIPPQAYRSDCYAKAVVK